MQNELIFEQNQLSTIDFRERFLSCLFDASRIADTHCSSLALQYLHPNELLIFKQRKKRLAQKEYLASRYIIKSLITKWHACTFETIHVGFDHVKNRLEVYKENEPLPYRISLSHSKGLVFIAVTSENNELGVDLEYIDSKRETGKLADSFFHSKESKLVALNGESEFYKLWTLKEAIAKIRGQSVMTTIGEDINHLSKEFHSISGVYHNFAIALVSSKRLDNITVNIVEIPLLIKDTYE